MCSTWSSCAFSSLSLFVITVGVFVVIIIIISIVFYLVSIIKLLMSTHKFLLFFLILLPSQPEDEVERVTA